MLVVAILLVFLTAIGGVVYASQLPDTAALIALVSGLVGAAFWGVLAAILGNQQVILKELAALRELAEDDY